MNVRQVRKKIKSVSNVKKITRSMQLVSAIKMKKSQQAAIEARPYQHYLEEIIKRVMIKTEIAHSDLMISHSDKDAPDLVLVVTANKGLCGSFNVDILRYLNTHINIETTHFVTLGKKGAQFLTKVGGLIEADYSSSVPISQSSAVVAYVLKQFLSGVYKRVFILYNAYISTLKTETKLIQLLPYTLNISKDAIEKKEFTDYVVEPNPKKVIEQILYSFVEETVRNVLIQSEAGEHSARMIAMKNATDNANDVIYNLTLLGNKLRQEKITNELLDMVTAKESVES